MSISVNARQIKKVESKKLELNSYLDQVLPVSSQDKSNRLSIKENEVPLLQLATEFHEYFTSDSNNPNETSVNNNGTFLTITYLQQLPPASFVSLVTYLCYYNDGVNPPELINLLYSDVALESVISKAPESISKTTIEVNKLKVLIEVCKFIRNELKHIKLDKINSFFKDETNIGEAFIRIVAQTEDNACCTLKILQSGQKNNSQAIAQADSRAETGSNNLNASANLVLLKSIKLELNEVAKKIEFHSKSIKGGALLDAKYNLVANGTIAFTGVFNTLSDFGALSTKIAGDIPSLGAPGAAELNTLAQIGAGFIWAANRKSSIGFTLVEKQAIGLYKKHLLKLIEIYYENGGKLKAEEYKFYQKFFAKKRGNKITNLFQYFTDSASIKQFNKLTKAVKSSAPRIEDGFSRIKNEGLMLINSPFESSKVKHEDDLDYHSFVDMKYTIKRLIQEEKYDLLKSYLTELKEYFGSENTEEIQRLLLITFKTKTLRGIISFRGNILAHLLKAYVSDNSNQALKDCFEAVSQMAEENCKEIKFLQKKSYSEILIWLNAYKVTNKHSFLIDWQHALLAIARHKDLSIEQKKSLTNWLSTELANKNNGKFEVIRAKQDTYLKEMALGTLLYQGLNLKRDVQGLTQIIPPSHGADLSSLDIATGALGWAAFSLLAPLAEHCNRGNTTTYTSAKKILHHSNLLIDQLEQDKTNQFSQNQEVKDSAIEPVISSQGAAQNETTLEQIITKLEELTLCDGREVTIKDNYLAYMALSSYSNGEMLLLTLFNQIITNGEQQLNSLKKSQSYKQDTEEGRNLTLKDRISKINLAIETLEKIWADAVEQAISLEQSYNHHLSMKNKPITNWDMNDFSKFCANNNFAHAKDALIQFYRIVGIINKEPDIQFKIQKINHLVGIITRLKVDDTSSWNILRKRTRGQELMVRSLIRVSGAVTWGAISTLLAKSVIGLVVLIPALILLDGIRGIVYGISTAFTHTNNKKEYIQACREIAWLAKNVIKHLDKPTESSTSKPVSIELPLEEIFFIDSTSTNIGQTYPKPPKLYRGIEQIINESHKDNCSLSHSLSNNDNNNFAQNEARSTTQETQEKQEVRKLEEENYHTSDDCLTGNESGETSPYLSEEDQGSLSGSGLHTVQFFESRNEDEILNEVNDELASLSKVEIDEEFTLNDTASDIDKLLHQETIVNGPYKATDKLLLKTLNDHYDQNMDYYHQKCSENKTKNVRISRLDTGREIKALVKIIENIVETVSNTTDKYLASQSLFRILAIIKLSHLAAKLKLAILTSIATSFNERTLPIAASLSLENDFSRKRSFFIYDALFGMTASATTIVGLPGVNLAAVYQVLIGGSGDVIGTLLLTLGLNQSVKNHTVSFQKCMKAIKHVLFDCLQEVNRTGEIGTAEIEMVSNFLQIHTGRIGTRYGETKSYTKYKEALASYIPKDAPAKADMGMLINA